MLERHFPFGAILAALLAFGPQTARAWFINDHVQPGLPPCAEQMPWAAPVLIDHLKRLAIEIPPCDEALSSHLRQDVASTVALVKPLHPSMSLDNALCGPVSLANALSELHPHVSAPRRLLDILRRTERVGNQLGELIYGDGMTFRSLRALARKVLKGERGYGLRAIGSAEVPLAERVSVTPELMRELDEPNVMAVALVKRARINLYGKFQSIFKRARDPNHPWPTRAELLHMQRHFSENLFAPRRHGGHYVVIRSVRRTGETFRLEILDPGADLPYWLEARIAPSRYGVDILEIQDPGYRLHVSYGDWPSAKPQRDPTYVIEGATTAIVDLLVIRRTP